MQDIQSASEILSAIVCYKSNLGADGKFHREGKIIQNNHGKNKLSDDLIGRIQRAFFK